MLPNLAANYTEEEKEEQLWLKSFPQLEALPVAETEKDAEG